MTRLSKYAHTCFAASALSCLTEFDLPPVSLQLITTFTVRSEIRIVPISLQFVDIPGPYPERTITITGSRENILLSKQMSNYLLLR